MVKSLKKRLLIAGAISLGIGVSIILLTFIIGFSSRPLTPTVSKIIGFSIGLPFDLASNIVGLFGCHTFGCFIYSIPLALFFYVCLGVLIGYIYHIREIL